MKQFLLISDVVMGNSNQDWKLLCIILRLHCTVKLTPFAERMTEMKGSGLQCTSLPVLSHHRL